MIETQSQELLTAALEGAQYDREVELGATFVAKETCSQLKFMK